MGWAQTLILAQQLTHAIKAQAEGKPSANPPPDQENTMNDDVIPAPTPETSAPATDAVASTTKPTDTTAATGSASTIGIDIDQRLGQVASLVDTLSKNNDIFLFLSALLDINPNAQNG